MNELQAAAAASAKEREAAEAPGRFSLYSTDTEEQMASVNRGLDRCASLLKCLLSPDSGRPQKQEQKRLNVGVAKRRMTSRHGNKVVMKQTKKHSGSSDQPKFPGALKHHHPTHNHPPHASSTPVKRHVRSNTEPLPVNPPTTSNPSVTIPHERGHHRRLRSVGGKKSERAVNAEKKNRHEGIPTNHPQYWPLAPYQYYHHHPMYYHPLCSCYYHHWQDTPSLPAHNKPTNQQQSLQSRSLPSFTCTVPVAASNSGTALHTIQALTLDMQKSVEECLTNATKLSGEGSKQAQKMVEELGQMLSQQCEQVRVQCQHFSTRREMEQPSSLELINQLQQLESEKSQLFEKLCKSDAAYCECRRELEKMNKKQHELQKELKGNRSRVETLQKSLQFKEQSLGKTTQQLKTTEEDLVSTRHLIDQLSTKSSLLQHQVNTLRQDLSNQNKENEGCGDQLAQVKCSLEAAQDEIEMMKVSMSSKEEQLLQCQDKLLGLRQCLAYFLSELTKMKPGDGVSLPVDYCVSGQAVEKIHTLVNDGNIETFLASYSDQNRPSSSPHSVSPSISDSIASSSTTLTPAHCHSSKDTPTNDVISPLQSSQTDHKSSLEQGPNNPPMFPLPLKPPSNSSLSTITALSGMTTSSELEFRRDLATLDHDIARLQMQFKVAMHTTPS